MNLPTVTIEVMLPNPEWVPNYVDGKATNMDEYSKKYTVEADVLNVNFNTGNMRVRFPFGQPWSQRANKKPKIYTMDVDSAPFFERYEVTKK